MSRRPGKSQPSGSRKRTPVAQSRRPSRARQILGLAGLPLVALIGIIAWWLLPFGDNGGNGSGLKPIATLDTPDVHSLLIDPSDPDHVLFGSHSGILESRDGGLTWQPGSLVDQDAMSMGTSPQDPATLYVAGHDVFQVSRDGGQTWQALDHNLPGTDIHGFAQDPTIPGQLYAYVAGDRIYASSDGGATWQPLPSQPSKPPRALASNGLALFVATEDGIEQSTDRGATWSALPAQPDGSVMTLAATPADVAVLYAGTVGALAKTSDGGGHWEVVTPPNTPVAALAVSLEDPEQVLFVTPRGAVYRSDDGGQTWVGST